MAERHPVKLADCKIGDHVVLRYRSGSPNGQAAVETWRLVEVVNRTPKFIVTAAFRFRSDGTPSSGGNRRYTLHDPTPEALAAVAETAAKRVAAEVARVAAEDKQRREELDKSLKAAEWLANKSSEELVAFLPGYALAGLWDTIEPRLKTADFTHTIEEKSSAFEELT